MVKLQSVVCDGDVRSCSCKTGIGEEPGRGRRGNKMLFSALRKDRRLSSDLKRAREHVIDVSEYACPKRGFRDRRHIVTLIMKTWTDMHCMYLCYRKA